MLYYLKPACHYEITSNQVITGCVCIVTIKLALLLLGFSADVLLYGKNFWRSERLVNGLT